MPPRTIELTRAAVEAAERKAVNARQEAHLLAEEARALVAGCAEQAAKMKHASRADVANARVMLAEAQALLARAEKLT